VTHDETWQATARCHGSEVPVTGHPSGAGEDDMTPEPAQVLRPHLRVVAQTIHLESQQAADAPSWAYTVTYALAHGWHSATDRDASQLLGAVIVCASGASAAPERP
jgi:hypothetical protein